MKPPRYLDRGKLLQILLLSAGLIAVAVMQHRCVDSVGGMFKVLDGTAPPPPPPPSGSPAATPRF